MGNTAMMMICTTCVYAGTYQGSTTKLRNGTEEDTYQYHNHQLLIHITDWVVAAEEDEEDRRNIILVCVAK